MTRANDGSRRLDVAIALNDKRYSERPAASRRRPSLAKTAPRRPDYFRRAPDRARSGGRLADDASQILSRMKPDSPDIDVAYVAKLARLELNEDETALFRDNSATF